MLRRCRHQWEIVGVEFTPPLLSFTAKSIPEDVLDEIRHGVTLIQLQCMNCNDLGQRRMLGQFTPRGFTFTGGRYVRSEDTG